MKYFFTILLVFVFTTAIHSQSEEWNQFRGGENQGVCVVDSLQTSWSESSNVLWKTAIPGYGHASPVIGENQIYITTAVQELKFSNLKHWSVLILSMLLLVFLFLFGKNILQSFQKTNKISVLQISIFVLVFFGLGLFTYFFLQDIYFPIPRRNDHITITNKWHYGAMVYAMIIAVATLNFTIKKKVTILAAVLILVLGILHLVLRPHPDYYPIFEHTFMTPTMHSVVKVIGLVALLIAIYSLKIRSPFVDRFTLKKHPVIIGGVFVVFAVSFFAGLFGVQLYRFVLYNLPAGIFVFPGSNLLLRDGYIFYRLILFTLIGVGFMNLFVSKETKLKPKPKLLIVISLLLVGVFLEKNIWSVQEQLSRKVVAIDKNTGELLWTNAVHQGEAEMIHLDNSFATPTPMVKKNKVYAYFGTPGLYALDKTGSILWKNTELPFYSVHGIGASPYYSSENIVIVNDMADSAYMAVVNAQNGKIRYKKQRKAIGGNKSSYRTPMVAEFNHEKYIIAWSEDELELYAIENGQSRGKVSLPKSRGEMVAGVLVVGDSIIAADMHHVTCVSASAILAGEPAIVWQSKLKGRGPIDASPVLVNGLLFISHTRHHQGAFHPCHS